MLVAVAEVYWLTAELQPACLRFICMLWAFIGCVLRWSGQGGAPVCWPDQAGVVEARGIDGCANLGGSVRSFVCGGDFDKSNQFEA
jgi:hypothetical protein